MATAPLNEPFERFQAWFDAAAKTEPADPNAMALASVAADGRPSVRMVLLKDATPAGFTFYTNLGSRKAGELLANPVAALCFHWKSQKRQVRVEGRIERVSDATADGYFATRHRTSQIGAWASKQSQPLEGRFALERRVAEFTAKFGLGNIPRPEFWSGFLLVPDCIEFWEDRTFRLHDRLVFRRDGEGWSTGHLYP
ncbi:MAG: pyridoxamine 5'-phosphate oxidase [Dongiaceae bacterium]